MSGDLTPPDLWGLATKAEHLARDIDAAYPALRRASAGDELSRRLLYSLDAVADRLRQAAEVVTEMVEDQAARRAAVLSYVWQDAALSDAEINDLKRDAERLNLLSWQAWLQHRGTCRECRVALETFGLTAGEPGPIERYPQRAHALTSALCETGRQLRLRAARHGGVSGSMDA